MTKRISASKLDEKLKFFIRGAELNDLSQARRVHEILNWMLTEQQRPDGQWWLTDYGKMVLADMLNKLSQPPPKDQSPTTYVLEAVMLAATVGDTRDWATVWRDMMVHARVGQLVQDSYENGRPISITQAAKNVADSGEFNLKWGTIRNIFYKVFNCVNQHPTDFLPRHIVKQLVEFTETKK